MTSMVLRKASTYTIDFQAFQLRVLAWDHSWLIQLFNVLSYYTSEDYSKPSAIAAAR